MTDKKESKRIDFSSQNIEELKEECRLRGITYTGLQTRTKMIDAILEFEAKPREPRVEVKMNKATLDKARQLSDYDKKQVARTPQSGRFIILSLQGGRAVLVNKSGQVVSPIAIDAKEISDLRRVERDMNMKDPEQKPHNKLLADTPKFGTVTEETIQRIANPIAVANDERGANSFGN